MSERPDAVVAASMAQALRDRDADYPVDVAVGRRTLAARTATARGRRQPRRTLLVVAAVTVVVLAVAALLIGGSTRRDDGVPAGHGMVGEEQRDSAMQRAGRAACRGRSPGGAGGRHRAV